MLLSRVFAEQAQEARHANAWGNARTTVAENHARNDAPFAKRSWGSSVVIDSGAMTRRRCPAAEVRVMPLAYCYTPDIYCSKRAMRDIVAITCRCRRPPSGFRPP